MYQYRRREFLKRAGAAVALGSAALDPAAAPAQAAPRLPRAGPVRDRRVATNGITLHVTEQGQGTPVLFVHRFPDTAYTWRRQMAELAAAGYRAIVPDTRGYGASSAPRSPKLYTPLQTVGDLVGLLDALKLDRVAVVGHDWGATPPTRRHCCVRIASAPCSR